MEIYGSVSFQSFISTYGSVTFQSSVKLVMEIYGSVSEAGEFGLRECKNSQIKFIKSDLFVPLCYYETLNLHNRKI